MIKTKYIYRPLIMISLIILTYTIYVMLSNDKTEVKTNKEINFSIKNFLNENKFKGQNVNLIPHNATYYAIFLITSDDCNPCLKEFESYSAVIKQLDRDSIFEQILIVADKDINRALWFSKTINFENMPTLFGYDSNYLKIFTDFEGTFVDRQIIFINNRTNKIVNRIRLARGILTDKLEKEKLLVSKFPFFN